MQTTQLDLTADTIDVRDIIARYEELENAVDGLPDAEERFLLASILDDLKGNGGDEQWRGDWYPLTLVRDSYFTRYACELIEDCGDIPGNLPLYIVIDWEATAQHVQGDYTTTEIGGVTYWYR